MRQHDDRQKEKGLRGGATSLNVAFASCNFCGCRNALQSVGEMLPGYRIWICYEMILIESQPKV
ncbi:hypothetical protein [Pseudorhodoplanes sinuspersici]|uniref:Uncharacterized protein n=1 Tax=Pseudorhodoplanes sinuspersici TaxID=1235591 RepID=A0A1W6ZWA7_9HYPH|nr:hypothetical protein [Pseudorhodoplanes sinuspersici]ARQ01652.1 hypothetical protein CAK95_23000 [Pseudorhodoplanes sinuspersici]